MREKKPQFLKKRQSEKRENQSMAVENNFIQPAIPKFDGHYDHWSMLMENFLRSKEYWSLESLLQQKEWSLLKHNKNQLQTRS